MKITLKDGKVLDFENALSCYEIAKAISEGLAREAVVCAIDGVLLDMTTVVDKDASITFYTLKDKEGLDVYRHTCSHILAQAVKTIYPTALLAIGPTIENGFYYDFDFKTPITMDDLKKIEEEMKVIIKSNLPISRFELPKDFVPPKPASRDEAKKTLADLQEGKSVSNEAMASCVQCKELTPDERNYLADMSVRMSPKDSFAEMLNAKTDSEKAKIKAEDDHDLNCWKFVKNEMRSDRFNHSKIAEERQKRRK